MKLTDIANPDYFHKVVDCQWACPAHTPVPEYIRLIAAGRYGDAYMVNWNSNVFPGNSRAHLRPAVRARLPARGASRRSRSRSAGSSASPPTTRKISARLPKAGGRSTTASASRWSAAAPPRSPSRDLAPHGYTCVIFDQDPTAGGMMRSQIPKFRLPDTVIDEECGYILDLGVEFRGGKRIDSMKALLAEGWDAVFVGSGAPRGATSTFPAAEAAKNIHIGIDWLSSVSFGHVTKIGKRVIVLGGGNTAMDCCRSSRRLGGEDVQVVVRSGFEEMKASPWEKEDAMHEGIPIHNYLVPKEFTHENGKLTGVTFEKVKAECDAKGRRKLVPTGEPDQHFAMTTYWSRSARKTRSPGSNATSASNSTNGTCPRSIRRPWRRPIRKCSSAAMRRSARRTSSGRWRTATRPRSRSTSSSTARTSTTVRCRRSR